MIKNIDRRTMIAGMAATPVLALPAMASAGVDPLFAAIRAHLDAIAKHMALFKGAEPSHADQRRAAWDAALEDGSAAEYAAAVELLNALGSPSVTLAGVTALMHHVYDYEFWGAGWPEVDDEVGEAKPHYLLSESTFHVILHRECARALERIAAVG